MRFSLAIYCSNTSSVTLRATPSPAGEGWQKSLLSSAQTLDSRPPCTFSGRADNACTNLLGFFVRYVRTRGIDEIAESGKTADFCFILCRTHLPRTARATNSCTPHGGLQGGRRESSLLTFAALLVTQKREKNKSYIKIKSKSPNPVNSQNKKSDTPSAFSFAYTGAKEKAIKKKTPK